ncbi:unnamed protein product [Rhizoctonia solani]|uniref:TPR-like protein n=1 Tax=Rhizoctonia solani TaxID=456999 RepID=A0A8H3A2S2_9AGAM|nr:unnamed protein product [Rhizoctonia solani]
MFEVDSKLNQAAKALAWPEVCVLATQLGGVIPPIETAKTFRSCPPPSPAFVGQEDALKKMEKAFWDGVEERHVFVLYGLGGGGKTQVALKFAQIHRNKFSEEFYIDATSVNTIEADLASLAAAKKAGKHYVIAIEWLANREGRWLLIFNNADDTSLHLRRYLPPCSHGDVLITTRNRQLISYAQGSHAHYQLSHMGMEDGKRLLLNMSGIAWDEANDKLAEAIVTELGCLALAITQAGAYIRVHECGLASYLDMYRVYRGELLEQYRYMTQKPDDYQWTVFTTWRVSLGKIGSRAIELLHLLSFMHHDQILEETFRRACVKAELEPMAVDNEYASAKDVVIGFLSEFRSLDGAWYRPAFLRLVTEIRSYSLIDFDATSGTYSIHPLVRYWIRTTIDDNQETEKRTTMLLALSITRDFEAQDYQYRVKLAPHIDALSTQYGSNPSIARKFALVYDEAGRFQAAKSLLEGAVEIDKRIYGLCHPDTLADTFELANAYHRGGELQAAERLHKIVLEGRIETLGDTHPDTYRARGYLAATYREQARLEEAVKIQLEVSEAAKTILGPEARESLLSQYALASTYMYQTQFQTAKDILTRLAEAQKRLLGPAHPDTLNSLELLADVLQSMSEFGDKLEEAEAIATQALEMRRQIFGEDHSRTLSCQAVLARIHFRQGQLDRARVTQEKIDSIQRRTLGELYVRTRAVRKDLALTYQSLGRFAEAEQVYRQVIEVGVQVFGPRHFDVVSNLVNLAKVCSLLGRQTEAEDMIAEKLAEISRIPINDPSTVVMLKINLAALHVKQRRWDEARVLVRYVVAALKPTQDPEYQLTRRDLHALNEVQETLRKEYFARCGYYLSSVFVVFLSLFLVYTQAL